MEVVSLSIDNNEGKDNLESPARNGMICSHPSSSHILQTRTEMNIVGPMYVCMYVCAIVKVTRTYFEMWVVLGIPVRVRGNAIGQVLSWGEWVKPFPVVLCVYVCTCE